MTRTCIPTIYVGDIIFDVMNPLLVCYDVENEEGEGKRRFAFKDWNCCLQFICNMLLTFRFQLDQRIHCNTAANKN